MATPRNESIGKAFKILGVLAAQGGEMSATAVARRVGCSVPTVHRLLLTLEDWGAVARTSQGLFQPGVVLATLGGSVRHNKLLIDAAQPELDGLTAEFREVSHLRVLNGKRAACLAKSVPARSMQVGFGTEGGVPLHCTASGKVLLAGLRPAARHKLLEDLDLTRYTDQTLTATNALAALLDEVEVQGYATDDEEWDEGLRCLAVPVRDGQGQVLAALVVSYPASRMAPGLDAAYRVELLKRSGRITHKLFGESRIFPNHARPRASFPHMKRVGDFIFISGTSSRRPDDSFDGASVDRNGELVLDIRVQTRAVCDNIKDMLEEIGLGLGDVVDLQAYLTDMKDYDAFNEVYAEYFGADGPARTTVAVKQLPHPHQLLMIKAMAYKPDQFDRNGSAPRPISP